MSKTHVYQIESIFSTVLIDANIFRFHLNGNKDMIYFSEIRHTKKDEEEDVVIIISFDIKN